MKILFFVQEFPKLSETFVLNQITGLIDQGHEVTILAKRKEVNDHIHEDVESYHLLDRVIYYDQSKNKFQKGYNFLKNLIKCFLKGSFKGKKKITIREIMQEPYLVFLFNALLKSDNREFDVIQAHFGPNGILANKLIQYGWLNGNLFTVFHGYDLTIYLNIKGNKVYNELFNSDSILLPISQYWKERLIDLGANSKKVIIHHMGIDVDKFEFTPQNYSGKLKIISSARFVEKKGLKYGVQAISQLVKDEYDISYSIIGGGPLEAQLRQLIADEHLEHRVNLLGWKTQQELIQLMREAQIILLPSVKSSDNDMEGIPVTLMEAMAMGKIVISTYHSGIPELITNRVDGFLVNERDVNGIVNVIHDLVRNNEHWIDIGFKARNRISKEFEINSLNDKLISIFKEKKEQSHKL